MLRDRRLLSLGVCLTYSSMSFALVQLDAPYSRLARYRCFVPVNTLEVGGVRCSRQFVWHGEKTLMEPTSIHAVALRGVAMCYLSCLGSSVQADLVEDSVLDSGHITIMRAMISRGTRLITYLFRPLVVPKEKLGGYYHRFAVQDPGFLFPPSISPEMVEGD